MVEPPVSNERILQLVAAHVELEGPLLPILHAVQKEFGFVPREAIPLIAHALNLSRAEVYGVVSFYHDFRSKPGGRIVKLCRAEACQSMGARAISAEVLKHYAVDWGGTTSDGALTVEPVYCLGLCAVAPAALVDGEPVAKLDTAKLIAAVEKP